jgi:hypothetical protein
VGAHRLLLPLAPLAAAAAGIVPVRRRPLRRR